MRLAALRPGDRLAAVGAVALTAALVAEWSDFGAGSLVLLILAIVAAVALVWSVASTWPIARQLVAGVLGAAAALAALAVGAAHAVGDGDALAWLTLGAALVLAAGAWWSIGDERTDLPDTGTVARVRSAPPA